MKRMPAKPLNESSTYIAGQRDKRNHNVTEKKDPNDPRTMEELRELPFEEYWKAIKHRCFQTEAWIRGEEYPMPFKIRMPEEGEVPDIELHATSFMSSEELESQAKMELEKENDV
jgi:hypothetical protein